MIRKKIGREDVEKAFTSLSQELKLADEAEEILITADANNESSEDAEFLDHFDDESLDVAPSVVTFSLRSVHVSEWQSIAVSPISKMSDKQWDFSCYPHTSGAKVNFDYRNHFGINITDERYFHWLAIAKALTFYCIPHFSITSWVSSYSSFGSTKSKVLRLVKFFQSENLYIGDSQSASYRTVNDLSPETIVSYLESLDSLCVRWELAFFLRFWRRLSSAKLLPDCYSCDFDLVSSSDVGRYRRAYDDAVTPYEPIKIDHYAAIVNHCLAFVEEYGEDILWLARTYYPSLVGTQDFPERLKLRSSGLYVNSREGIDAFNNYLPKLIFGEPWWPLKVEKRIAGESLDIHKIKAIVAMLVDASCILIMATTGIRRSEVTLLKSGCVIWKDDEPWLKFKVFKTSSASQGDLKTIPIPLATAKAIQLMECLLHEARTYGGHDYLFAVPFKNCFGMRRGMNSFCERACLRVAAAAGVDERIHPHRFRKSLAMYLIYQDSRNIDLIRHLFSHRSLKMTLRYILALPGIHGEVRRIIVDQNIDLLARVVSAAVNDRIGGLGGARVKATIASSSHFRARLQDLGKEAITQYVDSLLDDGVQLLHRTSMAICLRTPSLAEKAPCIGKNEFASDKLHPNLYACNPLACRFAAFLEEDIPALKSEITFHERLLRHDYSGTAQKEFSEKRIRDAFLRLREINADEADKYLLEVANG